MELLLKNGLRGTQLYERDALIALDKDFLSFLDMKEPSVFSRLILAREGADKLTTLEESKLLIDMAPYFENFLADIFGIEEEIEKNSKEQYALDPLIACKRLFIQRRVSKKFSECNIKNIDASALRAKLCAQFKEEVNDINFSKHVLTWLQDEILYSSQLDIASKYAAWALFSNEGKIFHKDSLLFKIFSKKDMNNLVAHTVSIKNNLELRSCSTIRYRNGFNLNDNGVNLKTSVDQANYCIWCHNQGRDSCSKGFLKKSNEVCYQENAFHELLTGCPLEQKISEMNYLKSQGLDLAALAVIIIDNPLVAATGHRICNDCLKSCIYQKQDPVDIPHVETFILKRVLSLSWGFEIYSLLTRWNPMNLRRPFPKLPSGYKVLIVGLGPAGFTLAHHLINEGHAVAAIDGLKIEPLPETLSGVRADGSRSNFTSIYRIESLYENLSDRVVAGFGGVMEYGITARWDKNFLKIIRLLLERRELFLSFGGVRFGGTLNSQLAFELGFDHIALCMGAGKPKILPLKNAVAGGVRQASDFLMSLQLFGCFQDESISNLQLLLPVIVIGGGLTAIDTATEAMAYYPIQVEKLTKRYTELIEEFGEEVVQAMWTAEDKKVFHEFKQHALELRYEREQAAIENRLPRIQELVQKWGGITIAYRGNFIDSPSYIKNHEEVSCALEEGIWFAENLTPLEIIVDRAGNVVSVKFEQKENYKNKIISLPARSLLIATGTMPNVIVAEEEPSQLSLDGCYFQAIDEQGNKVIPEKNCKPNNTFILTSICTDQRSISFFGDLHPSFAGNVVKAMASAKKGYPIINKMLSRLEPSILSYKDLWAQLNVLLRPVIHHIKQLTPNIIEIIIKAPLAARSFSPGQFYRFQNIKLAWQPSGPSSFLVEGIALTGAWVEYEKGLISTIVLENGGSSNICKTLKEGQPVVLMGPTGRPTDIKHGETVLLVGGGLGNAVLFSIGQALKKANCKVLYFAAYKKIEDRFKREEIEKSSDQIIWCCEERFGLTSFRPQDLTFVGNVIEGMQSYAEGNLTPRLFDFKDINRIIVIGSDKMMAAVAKARHTILKDRFSTSHVAIASINSPMQCMLKEICGQCLQLHIDAVTKQEKVVFSCAQQDQNLDEVDFECLNIRLQQNSLQEKITNLWVNYKLSNNK